MGVDRTPATELARLQAEVARLSARLGELQALEAHSQDVAGRMYALTDMALELPRHFQGGLWAEDFPAMFLRQLVERLPVQRAGLYATTAGVLGPLARVGRLPDAPWTGAPPTIARTGDGEAVEAAAQALAASVGPHALWLWDPVAEAGLLLADPLQRGTRLFVRADVDMARLLLRLFVDTRKRLAREASQQQSLGRARAAQRITASFLHFEPDAFPTLAGQAVAEVVEQVGAAAGCLYRVHAEGERLEAVCVVQGEPDGRVLGAPLGAALLRLETGVTVSEGGRVLVPILRRQTLIGVLELVGPAGAVATTGLDEGFLRIIGRSFAQALGAYGDRQREVTLRAQIQQAQKLEGLGALAGGIAHDFNNILTPILSGIELAIAMSRDRPRVVEPLRGSLEACDRARKLVRQILLFSRKTPVERRPVDLARLVLEAADLLRASLPATVTLAVDVDGATPASPITAIGDASQLVQVLVNLGTNAWHALGDAPGEVALRVSRAELLGEEAERRRVPPGRYAVLAVSDTGPGIPPAIQPHVFDPFFTTKPPGKGTGMGLAVVHGIVEEHGGQISFETSTRGTRFLLYLPVAGPPADSSDLDLPTGRLEGTERVMVVDDHPDIARRIGQLLRRLGYQVVTETSPEVALQRLAVEPCDLLITDYMMPDMNGLELVEAARASLPDLRVLLCTGFHAPLAPEVLAAARIGGTVLKPFRFTQLARQIRDLLDAPA